MVKTQTKEAMQQIIAKGWLVEFNRKPLDKHPLFGFMLACNDEFTLVQEFDRSFFRLDGFVIFQNDSVKNFRIYDNSNYFLSEVLKYEKIKPPPPPNISIQSWPDIMNSVSQLFPLIVVEQEAIDRTICYIGSLLETKKKRFVLRDIDPTAEWEKKRTYKFKDLTKVKFGGRYETVLASVNQKRKSSETK